MIKQMRASYFHNFKNAQYCALSDDPIPDDLENGDEKFIIGMNHLLLYMNIKEEEEVVEEAVLLFHVLVHLLQ